MHDQAQALAQAVAQSAENAVYAQEELEREIVARLTNDAQLLDRLMTHKEVSSEMLKAIATEIRVSNIMVYSPQGQLILASDPSQTMASKTFVVDVLHLLCFQDFRLGHS